MIRRALAWLAGRGEVACVPLVDDYEDGPVDGCDCVDCAEEREFIAWEAQVADA